MDQRFEWDIIDDNGATLSLEIPTDHKNYHDRLQILSSQFQYLLVEARFEDDNVILSLISAGIKDKGGIRVWNIGLDQPPRLSKFQELKGRAIEKLSTGKRDGPARYSRRDQFFTKIYDYCVMKLSSVPSDNNDELASESEARGYQILAQSLVSLNRKEDTEAVLLIAYLTDEIRIAQQFSA